MTGRPSGSPRSTDAAGDRVPLELLWSDRPLSFWGGYDATTGEIIDRRHPLSGRRAAGRALAVPETRGSSTTTAVLLEAIRAGTAPAALVTRGPDRFLRLATIVADELYGRSPDLVELDGPAFESLRACDTFEPATRAGSSRRGTP